MAGDLKDGKATMPWNDCAAKAAPKVARTEMRPFLSILLMKVSMNNPTEIPLCRPADRRRAAGDMRELGLQHRPLSQRRVDGHSSGRPVAGRLARPHQE